jgi:hypothetical protein
MNVEIGAEAALFPEKEYISGIFLAVRIQRGCLVARIPASSGSASSSPLLAASVSSAAVQPLTEDGCGQDCKKCNIFVQPF